MGSSVYGMVSAGNWLGWAGLVLIWLRAGQTKGSAGLVMACAGLAIFRTGHGLGWPWNELAMA